MGCEQSFKREFNNLQYKFEFILIEGPYFLSNITQTRVDFGETWGKCFERC